MGMGCGTLLAWMLAAASGAVLAQGAPAPAGVAASAPRAASVGPRRLSPDELRESASMPGDLRPAEGVTPQIVIPLRRGAAPAAAPWSARRSAAAASAGVDDRAARCEAASSRSAREKCLRARTQGPPLR